jgi:hypothetical protein
MAAAATRRLSPYLNANPLSVPCTKIEMNANAQKWGLGLDNDFYG